MPRRDHATATGARSSGWLASGRWIGALVVVAVVAALVVVYARPQHPARATVAPAHADRRIAGVPVEVDVDVCGAGWSGGTAGPQTFALWDDSNIGVEVYLQNVATRQVYFDAEGIGPGVTRTVHATIPAGRYRFFCLPSDTDGMPGPVERVTGSYTGATTPGMAPVTDAMLLKPIARYHTWVSSRFPTLQRQVDALAADVRRGDLAAAKRDWLSGHLTYETLGAAYDAFGPDDALVDARPSTSVSPVTDPHLVGFHKIEALLWHGAAPRAIAPYTTRLVRDVHRLRRDFVEERLQTIDIGLRSHEILENALQFTLTGDDDAGSHTSLATLQANLTGTVEAMRPIRSLLASRDPDLAATDRALAASRRLVASYQRHGRWTPLLSLTRTQRERLDAMIDRTVELLSENATITDPRGAPVR